MTYFFKSSVTTHSKQKIKIAENEVHLWVTKPQDFLNEKELLSRYSQLLSSAELTKQQRYKFAKDRHDALITRAFVRDLLTYYADLLPQDLQFEKGEKGKPELINFPLPLRFNLSHTKNLITCAVTLNDDIGCDVENTGRNNNVLAIAERYFSPRETTELFSLPLAKQSNRFFDYWTLKESYIKAWGLGLAIPLADFSFNIKDMIEQDNELFSVKDAISLSFAKHRKDKADIWRSWLLYPSPLLDEKQEHRIAISLRAKKNNQTTDYQLRFFNNLPLLGYQEI